MQKERKRCPLRGTYSLKRSQGAAHQQKEEAQGKPFLHRKGQYTLRIREDWPAEGFLKKEAHRAEGPEKRAKAKKRASLL